MRLKYTLAILVMCLLFFSPQQYGFARIYKDGGVTLNVSRYLTGSTTNSKYYGFHRGSITLPHTKGGMLSFSLWNDMRPGDSAVTNYFYTTIGGRILNIANYSTKNQVLEDYTQFKGQWGPGGICRITLAIPPGIPTIHFDNRGSATGIALSHLMFTNGYGPLPSGYERKMVRRPGAVVIKVGRILKGSKTGRLYYGHSGGTIFLPHGYGGYLRFRVYNDQSFVNCKPVLNKIHITAGPLKGTFSQYTTTMQLYEDYTAYKNTFGPAGGSSVTIQVPEEVTQVYFNSKGSQTGVEISEVFFSSGTPTEIKFEEVVNRSGTVCKLFSRTMYGALSGRRYHGFSGGRVILPNKKGGVLSFNFWNDQHVNAERIANQLHITAGSTKKTVKQTTTKTQRKEFYKELMNNYGPAGGKGVSIKVPVGVAYVDFNSEGSQSGFELSDFVFHSK